MITRGYYIGALLDAFSDLSGQIRTRNCVNLTDLTRFVEDFTKDVLNLSLGYHLTNLNDERNNSPGLDLGDKVNRVAFQITATKTSDKVSSTLEIIDKTPAFKGDYDTFIIFMLCGKQNKYMDELNRNRDKDGWSFRHTDIWDFEEICRIAMGLPVEKLKELHDFVTSNHLRVRVEFEIPDKDGFFPTSLRLESIPTPQIGNAKSFIRWLTNEETIKYRETLEDIQTLASTLSALPRITREFLAYLILHRERSQDDEKLYVDDIKLERLTENYDAPGDLGLLERAQLIHIPDQDNYYDDDRVRRSVDIRIGDGILVYLVKFLEEKELPLNKALVVLDFSDLD